MSRFLLNVITPEKEVLKEEVDFLVVPGKEGELGIMPGHIPFIAALKSGRVKIEQQNKQRIFEIDSGLMHISREKTTLLVKGFRQ